jgi:hypothetical protein
MDTFAEFGIQFNVIPSDRTEEVLQLLADNFFPDEPIFRSLGFGRNSFMDMWISEAINGGSCVMATDSSGKIIGVRLTEVIERNSFFKKVVDKSMTAFLPVLAKIAKIMGKSTLQKTCEVFSALFKELEFDIWGFFDELGCQKILNDVCVCTSKEARVKGLGTELVRQGEAVGKERGCEYSVNIVTGLYSGKIFRDKCHYTVKSEIFYARFFDKDGNLYLNDTREHLSCFLCYKNIS